MPKVSVISGFFNRAHLLERTIESILDQSFSDFELIVFDDASTDDTAAKLQALAAQYNDERFRYVIHEKNLGFVQGLVDAVGKSNGEYIAIQGSGDASLPHRLALQVATLDCRPEVAAVGGWYYNVQDDLGVRRLRQPDADVATFKDFLKVNVFSHGEVMIRRSMYESVGGYRTEFKNSQDLDLWLRLSKIGQFATVREPIYERYIQFDGVSYVPRKILTQSLYSTTAQRLAQMSSSEEEAALAVLREQGPAALVSPSDSEVQRKLTKAVLRLIFFGSPARGKELAKAASHPPIRKGVLVAFARVYGSAVFSPLRAAVSRAVGIAKGHNGD